MTRLHLISLAFLLLLPCATGCSRPDPRPNVILVLVDTLRADHMSLYGYERDTTPRLDRLARRGAVFEQARSQAACTFPSANVILTSTPALAFLGRTEEDPGGVMGIPPEIPTIAQVFQEAGYRTAAISASPIVRKSPGKFNPGGGFGAGFDAFDESCTWKKGDCVLDLADAWLTGGEGPYFLYLHLMEPHGPYQPESKHFAGRYQGEHGWIEEGNPRPIIARVHSDGEDVQWTEGDLQHLRDLYDDEIRSLDARLVPFLERRLEDDQTVVGLLSDHGESFLEKESMGHCRSVWDSEVRIPILFLGPEVPAARIPLPVEAMDLASTLVDLAGLERPRTFRGRSLLPLFRRPDAEAETSAMSQAGRWRSLTLGRTKLVERREGNGPGRSLQLFDVVEDPAELRDLSSEEPETTRRLLQRLLERDRIARASKPAAEANRQLDEHIEQLRALGYLE